METKNYNKVKKLNNLIKKISQIYLQIYSNLFIVEILV